MVSASHATHNLEITAENLQEDLARLEIQKQALERELAAVVAHLGSVRRTLDAIETLVHEAAQRPTPRSAGAAVTDHDRPEAPAEARQDTPSPEPDVNSGTTGPRTGGRQYGRLTEQILEYLDHFGDADVRARDIAAALGRDQDSASVNAVRSTLDRLVGTSRVRRTGRGLYRAKRP
ncbi:hypothetical protein [Streptomyces sp. NPDC059224]|uniref:hypothetical protein n=1 Tax=Streptomyces sp. NPDC059224 TaxID=3346775 RepID=UPI0036D12E48